MGVADNIYQGLVWTVAQWQSAFDAKQDMLGNPASNNLLVGNGNQWQPQTLQTVQSLIASTGAPLPFGNFPRPSFPAAYTNNCASGHNDLYTVPTGRKAIIVDALGTNSTIGAIIYYPELKIGSTYYALGPALTENAAGIGHNYGSGSAGTYSAPVLNAGETFSINANAVGMSFWLYVVEFDATCLLNRATLTTFTAGDNTLYTVPTGKTFFADATFGLTVNNNPNPVISGFRYFNNSGTSRTLGSVNLIPKSGSPNVNNQIAGSNVITTGNGFGKNFGGCLNAGDFVSVNTDANTAGQIAWFNYVEI